MILGHSAFAQNSSLPSAQLHKALGGVVDYDASLTNFFFDSDELEMMLADPTQTATTNSAVQNAAKRIDIPKKKVNWPFGNAPITTLKKSGSPDELAYDSPNYVRGYIILGNDHTENFRSYELYEQNGALLGRGPLYHKKTIRVPWEARGEVSLMLHGTAGSQSFQFITAP